MLKLHGTTTNGVIWCLIRNYSWLGSVKKTLSETLAVILQIEYPS